MKPESVICYKKGIFNPLPAVYAGNLFCFGKSEQDNSRQWTGIKDKLVRVVHINQTSKYLNMTTTQVKIIKSEIVHHDKYGRPEETDARFHKQIRTERKRRLRDKLKSIGEELLAWVFTISVISLMVYIFSVMKAGWEN